jgi:hypothetical protein
VRINVEPEGNISGGSLSRRKTMTEKDGNDVT